MGTLTGHVIPAVFFCVIGVWHLFSASVTYLRYPREYSARAWQPVPWVTGRVRSLELYFLLVAIPFAIFYELGISTGFHPLEEGVIPLHRIATFQHSIVLVMFWLFAFLVLVSETTHLLPLPVEVPFVLVGISFLMELSVIAEEAAQNSGLEGKLYTFLVIIVGTCAGCSLILAWNPKAFFVEFLFSTALILQGTWLFQIGFTLYVDKFIPEGCHRLLDLPGGVNGSTQCDLEDLRLRAMELMSFAFNCHVVLVMLFSVLTLGVVARLQGYRRGGYDPLNYEQDTDALQMKPMPKLSFDKRSRRPLWRGGGQGVDEYVTHRPISGGGRLSSGVTRRCQLFIWKVIPRVVKRSTMTPRQSALFLSADSQGLFGRYI